MNKKIIYCTLESLIYSIIIYLIFFTFSTEQYNFLSMNLHPLAIMTAFLALKYGTYIGFIGSFAAIITYLTAYLFSGNDLLLFFLKFQYYKFFLMFLFINVLLGKFKTNHDEREEKLIEEKTELEEKYSNQKNKNMELIILSTKLKNQIVNSKESIITLYHIKNSLKDKTLEQLYTEIILILKQFLNCDAASVYKLTDSSHIRSILKLGSSNIAPFISLDSSDAVRFREVMETGEITEFPIDLEVKQPVYISPIFIKDKISGFVTIEKLDFNIKERYSFELFKIVAEELEDSLVEIFEKAEEEKNEHYYTEDMSVSKWNYFNSVVEENEKRKKLFGYDYVLLEGKNPGYSTEDVFNILKDKMWVNDYATLNEKYIRLLFTMTDLNKKALLKEKAEKYFTGVDFYEI